MTDSSFSGNLEGAEPTLADSASMLHPHDFTDSMWVAARKAAYHQGYKNNGGNQAYAEDLASDVLATLLVQDTPMHPKAVFKYVRTAVYNRVCDDARRDNAAFRGGAAPRNLSPEDFVEHEGRITALIPAPSNDPAAVMVAEERERELVEAGAALLALLEERNRDLVRMALMECRPHAEVAQALGYKNANVVKQTLHRTIGRLREMTPEAYRSLLDPDGAQ